jgi:hypothetical protein
VIGTRREAALNREAAHGAGHPHAEEVSEALPPLIKAELGRTRTEHTGRR